MYFGSIAVAINLFVLLLTAAGLGGQLHVVGPADGGCLLLPVSELAVGLVNHLVTLALRPRVVPKLEFEDGIPADQATFIVIPSMLARPSMPPCSCAPPRCAPLPTPTQRPVRFAHRFHGCTQRNDATGSGVAATTR